ncbi:MAG: leucine-rich repeat domain-containing protein [Clostridia bacterium]|nr:leucine-rich repeat domain-containing protein [Clostridia bacterium]
MKSVEISSGMEWVCNYMFVGCTSLSTVVMPDSVTKLGIGVFYNSDSLTAVPIGNNVSIIGAGAFEDCDGFTEFTVHDNVTYIGKRAFGSCNGLKTLIIGSGVIHIKESVFEDCTRLSYAEFIIDEGWGLVHLSQHIPIDVSDPYDMAGILSKGNGRPYLRTE